MRRSLAAFALLVAASIAPSAHAGRTATAFTLKDVYGKKFDLQPSLGKEVVVVNFFATWCAPCMAELPTLQSLHEKYEKDGLRVVVVSIDDAKAVAKVKPLVKEQNLTFPVLLDTQTKVVSLYNPKKIVPFTVVIDRSGIVASEHFGFKAGDEVRLEEQVKGLLGSAEAAPEAKPDAAPAEAPDEAPKG